MLGTKVPCVLGGAYSVYWWGPMYCWSPRDMRWTSYTPADSVVLAS